MSLVVSLIFSVSAAAPAEEFRWPQPLSEQRILFAGAHPDDEWGVAPLLAQACIDEGAKCHFVVASKARSYGCLPSIGLRDPGAVHARSARGNAEVSINVRCNVGVLRVGGLFLRVQSKRYG